MLCLSGFELYSRSVPLLRCEQQEHKKKYIFAGYDHNPSLLTKCAMFVLILEPTNLTLNL